LYGLELKDAFAGSGAKTTRTIDPTTGADIITTEPYSLREYFEAYEVPGSEMAIKALDVTRSELANIKPGDKQSVVNAIQKFSDIIGSLPINTRMVRDQDGKLISVDFNRDAGLIYQAAKIALQKQLNGISAIEDRRKAHDEFYGQSDQNGGSQSAVLYDSETLVIPNLFDEDEQTDGWTYRVEGEFVIATSPDGKSFQTDMPVEEARRQGLIR
jgi:hypothetical protein